LRAGRPSIAWTPFPGDPYGLGPADTQTVPAEDSIEHEWVPIGTLLLRLGLISVEQLELALGEKESGGQRLGELLVSWGWVSSRDIAIALAEQFQLPFRDIAATPPPATDLQLPEWIASELDAVVLDLAEDHVEIGVGDPTNIAAIERLRDSLDRPISIAVIDPESMRAEAGELTGAAAPGQGVSNDRTI
jgi:MshEN domain